jgi:hypothetical protein
MKKLADLIEKYAQAEPGFKEVLDFHYADLLQFIPYNKVKQFLEPDVTREKWRQYYRPLTVKYVLDVMRDYMKFAWKKCLNERGLSAMRSLAHFRAWLWILQDYEALQFINLIGHYGCYGAPCLKYICDKYRWNYKDFIDPYLQDKAEQFIQGKGCTE